MKNLYLKYLSQVDAEKLNRDTKALFDLEMGVTFSAYHAAAQKAYEILKETGIPNAEIITFPADGKTAYQDKITPMGWEATTGKLTILSGFGIERGFVAADFQKHPFHLIKGSSGTRPEGETVRIITDQQMLYGENPQDALVMVPPNSGTSFNPFITRALDLGVRGFITDYAMNAKDAPDGIQWCNAFTERNNWHVTADDRPFIAFCITPQTGEKLRYALARGPVTARIESDAKRMESTVDVVTAMVPGKRKEEFWIFAHLYEPLSNDNSSGVAAAIETARLLMAEGQQEFSLRLIFGLEYYGFAAYAATRGKYLGDEVIGGCDYDAMYLRKEWSIRFRCAAPASPFYGNYLGKILADDLRDVPGAPVVNFQNAFENMYDDDSFLTDSTVGIPTVWPIRTGKNFWHNSKQTFDYVQKEAHAKGTALNTAFVSGVINPQQEILKRVLPAALEQLAAEIPYAVGSAQEHLTCRYETLAQDLDDFKQVFPAEEIEKIKTVLKNTYDLLLPSLKNDIPHSTWRDYMEQIVPVRLETGFPFDLAKVPAEERFTLLGSTLYSPLAAVLSDMDGKRNLAEIIRRVEHETRKIISEPDIRKILSNIFQLSRWGYISLQNFKGLSKADILKALQDAGIRKGDHILLHSKLSVFGLIDGGAKTVIEAFRETVGEEGCFLLPAFNSPFIYIGGLNCNPGARPFDPADLKQIWTGNLPKTLLKEYPDAVRSAHISHSWCGIGKNAAEACKDHLRTDPPMGTRSPLEYILKKNGKIVHFGNEIGSTTFLHLLEDRLDLPGVEDTFCKIRKPNGYSECVVVPRNLPGDRDFYRGTKDTIRFFKAAQEKGLQIRETTLGNGVITVMDVRELYDIGYQLLSEDPYLLLMADKDNLSTKALIKAKEV